MVRWHAARRLGDRLRLLLAQQEALIDFRRERRLKRSPGRYNWRRCSARWRNI
jgi:hypothetical protein